MRKLRTAYTRSCFTRSLLRIDPPSGSDAWTSGVPEWLLKNLHPGQLSPSQPAVEIERLTDDPYRIDHAQQVFDYDLLVNLEETLGKEKVEEEWAAGREEGTAALDLESPENAGTDGRRPAGGPTSIVV